MEISDARARQAARPLYLVEIRLGNSGPTLYLSDARVAVGGRQYEDYMQDLSGVGAELRRLDSGGLNEAVTLRFRNDPFGSYGFLVEIGDDYPFEGAPCVIKETYLDPDGGPSEEETIFEGVLEEPSDIDLLGFACKASGVQFRADLGE